MAEGVLKQLAEQHQLHWQIDSAGTEEYHVGQPPDRRAIDHCMKNGIDISGQRARQIRITDFSSYDLVYALAENVFDELHEMQPPGAGHSGLRLLLDEVYPGQNRSVPDPWYGNQNDFAVAYDLIFQACEAIVKRYAGNREESV
jgi:protein-tyrosine phosphatase